MNICKIKTSFVILGLWSGKTGKNIMIFILIFVVNCLKYDAIHDFSVWFRTGSNPADIIRIRSHIGKYFKQFSLPLHIDHDYLLHYNDYDTKL